jgi:tetratricopeptide (TPR) repeat protein
MKKADEKFIKKAAAGFGDNRYVASIAWARHAAELYEKSNSYYAMRRYNQAWLLYPNNYLVYWGFGRITLGRSEFDKSINFFEQAKQLINDESQKNELLSDTGVAYSYKAMSILETNPEESSHFFKIANQHFTESITLDPTYGNAWKRWAYSLYKEGNYSEAWKKTQKARSLNAPNIDKFIERLSNKMPEPQE